ncbi:hypothetical protein FRC02_004355 [Tulasnella sp. 418]|nr:hypothetical protein FRC02_004355 [Tulasnella sp. 418]
MSSISSLSYEFESTSATPAPTSTPSGYFDFPINRKFSEDLSLGNDNAVDKVLADVPFFAIGVLAFAVITFFLAKHRVSKSIMFAFLSAVIGFTAAVIDLGALLASDTHRIFGLLIARETGYAVSIGMRLIFYWKQCSDPPPGELEALAEARNRRISLTPGEVKTHSASWTRWGKVGLVGQLIIFAAALGVMGLQITWRFCAVFREPAFTEIYRASSILLIVVSLMLLFKYKANVYLSPKDPRSKALVLFSPMMLALFVGIGVAIGDLLVLRFSESCLGRLLQVSELYLIFMYLLITASPSGSLDGSDDGSLPVQRPRNQRDTTESFQGVNLRSSFRTFRVTPPTITTPEFPAPTNNSKPSLLRQGSTTERLSKWISDKVSVGKSTKEDRLRLWSNGDAEKTGQWEQQKNPFDLDLEKSPARSNAPLTSENGHANLSRELLVDYKIMSAPMPSITPTPAQVDDHSIRASLSDAGHAKSTESKTRVPPVSLISSATAPRESGFSLVKAYEYSRYNSLEEYPPTNLRTTVNGADSPIYGLDGIIKNLAARDINFDDQSSFRGAQSDYGIAIGTPQLEDGEQSPSLAILRKAQADLDESVAKLQLLSPESKRASASAKSISRSARQLSPSPTSNVPPTLPPLVLPSRPSTPPQPPLGAWPLPPAPALLPKITTSPESPAGSWPLPPLPTTTSGGDGSEGSSDPSQRPSVLGQVSISTSVGSEFSLSNFPSPPAATTGFLQEPERSPEKRRPSPSPVKKPTPESFLNLDPKADESGSSSERIPQIQNTFTVQSSADRKGKGKDPSEYPSPPKALTRNGGTKSSVDGIEGIPFKLAPPKMPAVAAESAHSRQLSFPSTTRGSDLSGIVPASVSVLSKSPDSFSPIDGPGAKNTSPTSSSNSNTTESPKNATPTTSSTVEQPIGPTIPKIASLRKKTTFGLPISPRQQLPAPSGVQGIATGRVVAPPRSRSGSTLGRNISAPLVISKAREPSSSFERPRPAPVANQFGGLLRGPNQNNGGTRTIGVGSQRPF